MSADNFYSMLKIGSTSSAHRLSEVTIVFHLFPTREMNWSPLSQVECLSYCSVVKKYHDQSSLQKKELVGDFWFQSIRVHNHLGRQAGTGAEEQQLRVYF